MREYLANLDPDSDLDAPFEGECYGQLVLGEIFLPTGEVVVSDPLCYLGQEEKLSVPFVEKLPSGKYTVTLGVLHHPEFGDRYAAARLSVTDQRPVRYQLALRPGEKPGDVKSGAYYGFGVDTGLGCFCDRQTEGEYSDFLSAWRKENPNGNHYNDYFEGLFAENYRRRPELQREGGDWLDWTVPGTEHNLIMFNSGFGDGYYPAFWGYDAQGEICCLTVRFIGPKETERMKAVMEKNQQEKPRKNYKLKAEDIEPLVESKEFCIATDRITVDGMPVGYMYREEPIKDAPDSGWRFFFGDESPEYLDVTDNSGIYSLNTLANYDQSIIPYLEKPKGSAFIRDKRGKWKKDR